MADTQERGLWRFFAQDEDSNEGDYLKIAGSRRLYTFSGTFREASEHIEALRKEKDPRIEWGWAGIFIDPVPY